MQGCARNIIGFACFAILVHCGAAAADWTTPVDSGPSANRVDLVIMGDGYTDDELETGVYDSHVDSYIDFLFADTLNSAPFHRYRNYFNVHSIEVSSSESGADIPPEDVFRNTALDATFYADGETERLLSVSTSKASAVRDQALADAAFSAEMQIVTVNSNKYGGAGGPFATFAGGNSSSSEIALHELAHSFSNLADEYGGLPGPYDGPEPSQVNLTKDPSGAKWSHWLGHIQPGIGEIGAYQGGGYHDTGLYRPSINSKMRSLHQPFDAVSREKIILDIYALVDPLDTWTDNASVLDDPAQLSVTPIDPDLIEVDWLLDGSAIPSAEGFVLDFANLSLAPGSYVLSARAFDPTGFDTADGWVRQGQETLEQFITWDITIAQTEFIAGDYNGDNMVDADDYTRWKSTFGQSVSPFTSADGNGNGVIDLADYSVWRDNLGSFGATSSQSIQTAEPASIAIVMGTAIFSAVFRWRFRR